MRLDLQIHLDCEVERLEKDRLRTNVLRLYGVALLLLLGSIPLGFLCNPIVIGVAVGLAFFLVFMILLSFASAALVESFSFCQHLSSNISLDSRYLRLLIVCEQSQ
jgi:fatty-acid desaturase